MFITLTQIINWLLVYKYFVLLPVVIIEGPIVTIIAGFLASLGHINPFIAYGVIVVGDLIGDCMYYSFGRFGRKKVIERWGHYIGITLERVRRLETHFEKHSGKTLIISKLTHAVGPVFLVAAGVAKVPIGKFVLFNLIPTLPKSLILLLVGYYFGKAYAMWNTYLGYTAIITICLAIFLLASYLIIKAVRKKYENTDRK
jgi:membrane protein DedA with SNARE-associated domain